MKKMNSNINVMLVEDNPQYREVIELALTDEPHMELVCKFGAAEVALHHLIESKGEGIDVILLDIRLPGMKGTEAVIEFKQCNPDIPILMLTQSNKESDVIKAIQAGAEGYLLKSSSIAEITSSIETVIHGGAPLDPGVARYLLQALHTKPTPSEFDIDLSPRETDILELMSTGLVKKEIADKLNISSHTVAEHVKRIYSKLNVNNAPAAVSKAYSSGLLPKNTD